jgi:hypothetical protein
MPPVTKLIADVSIGGTGADNPVPLTSSNFNFDEMQLRVPHQMLNVSFLDPKIGRVIQVTGMVDVDASGNPMISANSLVYLPCPPSCPGDDPIPKP